MHLMSRLLPCPILRRRRFGPPSGVHEGLPSAVVLPRAYGLQDEFQFGSRSRRICPDRRSISIVSLSSMRQPVQRSET